MIIEFQAKTLSGIAPRLNTSDDTTKIRILNSVPTIFTRVASTEIKRELSIGDC